MPRFPTLPEILQHWAQKKPDFPAFVFRDKNQKRTVLTWANFHTLSGRLAADLRVKGVVRGGLVVITLPNSPERAVCEAGVWMSGAVPVNGQCLMSDGSDLMDTLSVSRAPTLILDPDVTNSPWHVLKNHVVDEEGEEEDGGGEIVTSSKLPYLKRVIFVRRVENEGTGDFLGRLKTQEEWFASQDVQPDDVFYVFTTSGTTGFSKLVMRTLASFLDFLHVDTDLLHQVSNDRVILSTPPMGWFGGSLISSIANGNTLVSCDMRPGIPDDMAQFLWTTVQEEKCQTAILPLNYVPALADIMENESGKGDPLPWKVDRLPLFGFPIPKHLVKAAFKVAHNVTDGYGSTELGPASFLKLTDASQEFTDHDTGHPLPDVQVKIVNMKDESKPCGPGQTGQVLVKSRYIMAGYLNNPQATAEAFTGDGFFRTGDLGRLDDQGHLIVDGRESDAIMRGPYIFYPTWIEKRLRECPGIQDVVVVGVPDPCLGEELCACVVPGSEDLTVDEVREFAETVFVSKDDPLSACPRHFVTCESFPFTDTGKPQRKVIKHQATLQLGLLLKSD